MRILQSNYNLPSLSWMSHSFCFSDECGQDDLPWKISTSSVPVPFTGFEEAGLESLAELTKVITSNILNIDVPGRILHYYGGYTQLSITLQTSSQ